MVCRRAEGVGHASPATSSTSLESLTAITVSMKIARPAMPAAPAPMPPRLQVEIGPVAEVGDHEQEHDHHGAGVHEQLRDGDEVALQHEVQRRQRGEVQDQRERGQERVALHDDGDRRSDRSRARDVEDRDAHQLGRPRRGSASTRGTCRARRRPRSPARPGRTRRDPAPACAAAAARAASPWCRSARRARARRARSRCRA